MHRFQRYADKLYFSGKAVNWPLAGLVQTCNTAPIIHWLENHPGFGSRFQPLFEAHRYRTILESWQVVELDSAIAECRASARDFALEVTRCRAGS